MRPEDLAADSEFEAIKKVGEIADDAVHRIRVEQYEGLTIDLKDYWAIIAGGSPFDVSLAEDKKTRVQKNVENFFDNLFDQVVEADFPFFGACSGNGLLGMYCGTKITGKYAEKIGSALVKLTDDGRKDPLLQGLPDQFEVMVGHKEACDHVPPGSVLLITSDTCPIQMFRLKRNIYAAQFHPEADADEFIVRIDIYKNYGYFDPESADELEKVMRTIDTPEPKKILKRFIERYSSLP